MAIGWLSVLQMVPWSDVIKNAPKVADGAKKLWKTVGKKPTLDEITQPGSVAVLSPEAQAIASLRTRVAATEADVSALHAQMLASSELISTLAEQNTQLIQRVERNRVQLRWLAGVTLLAIVLALATVTLLYSQLR